MRNSLLGTVLALAAGPALAADPVEGPWMVDSETQIEIGPCADRRERMCGVITWLKHPRDETGQPARDVANPDPRLRSRTLVGMPFIHDFHHVEPGHWTGGKMYDPASGKTYESSMRINPDGTLKLDGCLLVFCESQIWRRPAEPRTTGARIP